MDWQEAGVALIVLGAVAFLARRLFGRATPRPKAATFVPLRDLKKKRDDGCH